MDKKQFEKGFHHEHWKNRGAVVTSKRFVVFKVKYFPVIVQKTKHLPKKQ